MKLHIVPPRTGLLWVKLGIRTFWRKPMAMTGQFFLFLSAMTLVSVLPIVGSLIALLLLPGTTLGLMAATREADQGRLPVPMTLLVGFRSGPQRLRSMLVLGGLYAGGFLLVMAASALADGGQFAGLYLGGGKISPELLEQNEMESAVWVALLLYAPLSILFWHAPGLVHWHGVSPVKSLFFSAIACAKNFGAFTVFALTWAGVMALVGLVLTTLATLLSSPSVLLLGWFPTAMALLAMFFCSLYFTFRDCFQLDAITGVTDQQPD